MQDALARQIVDSLSLTLTAGEQHRMQRDAPASAEAYELYLRANQLLLDVSSWTAAIDAYRRSVELDPRFAPAWARLGRCYRLIGKFGNAAETSTNLARGEQAIKRALEINPELSLAHHLYAYIEVEARHAREAMMRLLDRVRQAPSEPELFAELPEPRPSSRDARLSAHRQTRRGAPA